MTSFMDSFSGLFDLNNTISPNSSSNPDDVLKTKSALNATGHYDIPEQGMNPFPDTPMFEGLTNFQNDNGLQVDAVMKPDGPTAQKMGMTLNEQGISQTDLLASTETPKPQVKKLDPLTGLPEDKAPKLKPPTAKQWQETKALQEQKTKPLTSAIVPEGDTVQRRISSMMQDKRYNDKHDTRLRDHVVKQFEKAYPGKVQYDETGKMVQPKAAINLDEVEPFDPDGELAVTYTVSDDDEKTPQAPPYKEQHSNNNFGDREEKRIDDLRNDRPFEMDIKRNPNANGDKKFYEVPKVGYDTVRKFDPTIKEMAERHGTDPDMLRAVMWAENARGHKFGGNALADKLGWSNSKTPMNINPKLWGNVLGKEKTDLSDPRDNIEAAAIVLKRLENRINGKKDAAKIGTIWNSTGQNETTDFGEYIGRVYREKPWLKPDPIEGDRSEPDGP